MNWTRKSRSSKSVPKNKGDESKAWEEGSQTVSVYDFLYRDTQRIDLLLAQFEGVGTPRERTRVEEESDSTSKGRERQTRGSGGVSATAPVIKGAISAAVEGKTARSTQRSKRSSGSITYDQNTINTLTLLDNLNNNSMIQRDVTKAGIGQVVLVSGKLSLFDYSLFEKVYQIERFRTAFSGYMKKEVLKNAGDREKEDEIKLFVDVAGVLNPLFRFYLKSKDIQVYGNLNKSDFTSSTEALLTNHKGLDVGDWHVLGTLDRSPQEPKMYEVGMNPIDIILRMYQDAVYRMFGGGDGFYALTPLMIFREVEPISSNPGSDTESRE